MASNTTLIRAVKLALIAAGSYGAAAVAQDAEIEQVVVTGTRITLPGVVSASPILSVGAEEIRLQQAPSVEKVIRVLPATVPGDNANLNNGSAGTATVNLRGLGSQRNLILMDGKRLTPYNINGIVDTSIIPAFLVERFDIVTGGASAVYGSDAISGALNFIMRKDFEGVALSYNNSFTGKGDGDIEEVAMTLGANVADGRGNVVLGLNWNSRDAVLFGDRRLGRGSISSSDGAGYEEFRQGEGPPAPPAGCGGPTTIADGSGGSGTTLPTRVGIAGSGSVGQFQEDGTLKLGNCNQFNFNPYNFYQTPGERYGAIGLGSFEINEHAEAYARLMYTNTTVKQQVAPGGIFGSAFWTPLANPLIGAQAQGVLITEANKRRVAAKPTVIKGTNWRDQNNNGVVDAPDYLNMTYNRRTLEIGPRSTDYTNDAFQLLGGVRGNITGEWNYDLSYQYGQADRTNTSGGYANTVAAALAVDSLDGVTCVSGGSCVPADLWGGYGAISPQSARYMTAVGLEQQIYSQMMIEGSATGTIYQLPWADKPIAVTIGAAYRAEQGETIPDECLKLEPGSCLGGRGGNTLPIVGGYRVHEYFGEAIAPLVSGLPGLQTFDLELGYRYSDYDVTGADATWKYGFSWRPFDSLLVRVMQQRASRAPNVGELAAPQTTALDDARGDPCSVGNAANITPELTALCISTGMTAAQVGSVADIEAGQINAFQGTDLDNLPDVETADTFTAGLVWTPDFGGETFKSWVFSVDYYDISIDDYIGNATAQEILDGCYIAGTASECDKIVRVFGGLTIPGSGVEEFTTNLVNLSVSGIEASFSFGVGLGDYGDLTVTGNVNQYLEWERQSSTLSPILDCLGYFGKQCDSAAGGPLPETRWIQRTTWNMGLFTLSYLWRHQGSVEVGEDQREDTYEAFRKIDSYDYFDLYAGVTLWENTTLSAGVNNVFDNSPPIVGNDVGGTGTNGGNTYPGSYDTLGRVWTLGVDVKF